jgi:hypothetical protein
MLLLLKTRRIANARMLGELHSRIPPRRDGFRTQIKGVFVCCVPLLSVQVRKILNQSTLVSNLTCNIYKATVHT